MTIVQRAARIADLAKELMAREDTVKRFTTENPHMALNLYKDGAARTVALPESARNAVAKLLETQLTHTRREFDEAVAALRDQVKAEDVAA